jgi:uncharacterized protein YjbI with pentapeptide repeats
MNPAIGLDQQQVPTNLTINKSTGSALPANLSRANLRGVDVSKVDLTNVKMERTIMPDGKVRR